MRRSRKIAVSALVLLAAIISATYLFYRNTAPESARLLPEADGYVYIHFELLRRAGALQKAPIISDDPEYKEFVAATGFSFDRDLDQAAFALHEPGPEAPSDSAPRYTEVFAGRIDRRRATDYLHKLAAQTVQFGKTEMFSIPHEGRTVRVAFLRDGLVTVSNTLTERPIQSVIEKYEQMAPIQGSEMLSAHYKQLPFGSFAWLIARTPAAGQSTPGILGTIAQVAPATVLVGSLRYLTALEFRLTDIAASPEQAQKIAESANSFLELYRSAEQSLQPRGGDPDVKAALASVHIQQQGPEVTLSADIPKRVLQKIAAPD